MYSSYIVKSLAVTIVLVAFFSTVSLAQEPASSNYKLHSYGFGSGGVDDSVSPALSLIGYWKFDEGSGTTAIDSSSYGIDGTVVNGPLWVSDKPALNFTNPYALDFDGVNDYVNTHQRFNWTQSTSFTKSFWINPDSVSTIQGIMGKGAAAGNGNNNWEWSVRFVNGRVSFVYWNTGGTSVIGVTDPDVINVDQWYHFLIAYDAVAGVATLYKDGVAVAVDSDVVGTFQSRTTSVLIGHAYHTSGANYYFNGTIDDVRFYDRALSIEEINSLANGENVAGYRISGISGELSGEQSSGNNYRAGPGLIFTQQADVPPAPTFVNSSTWYNKLHLTIDPSNNPVDAKFAVAISTDGFATETKYVKMDGTLGDTLELEDYRTYATWGGASGDYVIGLTPSKTYTVKVKAIHGDFTETGYGPTASATTLGPQIRFDIDIGASDIETSPPYAIDLGDLFGDVIVGSSEKVWIDFETNAEAGGRVYIAGNNDGLLSSTVTHTISSISGDLSAVQEGFGVQADSASAGSGGPFTISSLYDVSGNVVGITDATIREIFVSDNPIVSGRAAFTLKAKSSDVTPAANDYTEILNIIAASMF